MNISLVNQNQTELNSVKEKFNNDFLLHVTVQLLLIIDNKILLLQRKNTGYEDGNYSLVGGHLEKNEDLKSALIREVKEEINIKLYKRDLKFASIVHRKGSTDNYINIFFSCSRYSGKIVNMEKNKCSCICWFDIDNLPYNIAEIDKKVILNMSNKNNLIEYGW